MIDTNVISKETFGALVDNYKEIDRALHQLINLANPMYLDQRYDTTVNDKMLSVAIHILNPVHQRQELLRRAERETRDAELFGREPRNANGASVG